MARIDDFKIHDAFYGFRCLNPSLIGVCEYFFIACRGRFRLTLRPTNKK